MFFSTIFAMCYSPKGEATVTKKEIIINQNLIL